MGNTWDFTIYPAQRDTHMSPSVALALRTALHAGYQPRFPTEVTMPDGLTQLTVGGEACLVSLLSEHGGLVTLWDDMSDDIVFSGQKESGAISFGELRGLSPEHDGTAAKILRDLEQMFLDTCTSLNAWYGFSTDAWSLESRFRRADEIQKAWARHERSFRAGAAPHLLFWLNYFDAAYWRNLDESLFEQSATVEPSGAGVTVRTGSRPPSVAVLVLSPTTRFE